MHSPNADRVVGRPRNGGKCEEADDDTIFMKDAKDTSSVSEKLNVDLAPGFRD